ncbi:MAG TPA: transcriptional repressor LexA [Candidatus Saccharimonadales bacterium]|nr:transcriptional repressor LexA [Candidatus Saccharimonadales bacterium]
MRAGLTERQDEIYQFLLDQRDRCGVCPTQEEIRQHFGFRSQTTVQEHLRLLEKKGFIKRNPGKARSIQLTGPGERTNPHDFVNVPLVGWIPAGNPAFALECQEDVLSLSRRLFRERDLFALRVHGDSMVGAGIFDGDLAILSAGKECDDGVIAAVVLDEEATLKRIFRTPHGMRLHAENPNYNDRIISENSAVTCRVAGVLVGTIRRF